ncbi:MAG TPA: hypothetical protein VFW96_13980 [Thermomicrobiales bacterium]|nr:hypothetical protein [Thermomicrobiales bacterium]
MADRADRMFDRAAQVNGYFAGGSARQAELLAALRELGLAEGQFTVIERAAPSAPPPPPARGVLARWRGRAGVVRDAGAPTAPPDLTVMAYLGQDAARADGVQELFHRFGATRVNYYPPGAAPGVTAPDAPAPAGEAE